MNKILNKLISKDICRIIGKYLLPDKDIIKKNYDKLMRRSEYSCIQSQYVYFELKRNFHSFCLMDQDRYVELIYKYDKRYFNISNIRYFSNYCSVYNTKWITRPEIVLYINLLDISYKDILLCDKFKDGQNIKKRWMKKLIL
jgi:hypothetical protein